MSNWRISSFGGVLLAGYFIPTWTTIVWHIVTSPVRGMFERPSVAVALYATDYLQLQTLTAVRFAWLLALGRLTVVAFFALFLVLAVRSFIRKRGSGREALAIALTIGSVISFASVLMAAKVGEVEALRLHASELLVMLGTGIVMLLEPPAQPKALAVAVPPELPVEEPQLSYNN